MLIVWPPVSSASYFAVFLVPEHAHIPHASFDFWKAVTYTGFCKRLLAPPVTVHRSGALAVGFLALHYWGGGNVAIPVSINVPLQDQCRCSQP